MNDQPLELMPLETAVLHKMLDKEGELYDVLRQQLACALISRKLTGVGFFTHFTVPSDAEVRRDLPNKYIHNVGAQIDGLQYGVGFVLFVQNGVISCLEGYSYGEQWVDISARFTLLDIPGEG